jgi:hypothetical protein
VVTFYPVKGGSPEKYILQEIERARQYGLQKRIKLLKMNLKRRGAKKN